MNSPTSPRRSPRWIAAGVFAVTLALVPALVACGSSSPKAVDCSSKSSATTDSTEALKPADTRTKSLSAVKATGDFGSKPTVSFDTAFVGETEEHIVLIPGTGDEIKAGQVVCIIEAMKLFNEIESEISGRIVKVLVDNSSPVEYDQPLFLVDPS